MKHGSRVDASKPASRFRSDPPLLRDEWVDSSECDHVSTVCLNCCSPTEREALEMDRQAA